MESTGKYWIPIFNYLEHGIHVCLTHPKYVKAIKGKKIDRKDSKWIADLFKLDLVRSSFIPPKDFRQLREIASVLSDPFGKTATQIMPYLLEHSSDSMNEKAVKKLIRKGTKASSDDIIEAIKGYRIETDQAKKLELARGYLDYLNAMVNQTEVELYVRIRPYYEFVEYVSTLSCMAELSSTIILAETGVDMSVFESDKHLCSWCGLAPANNESAGKKKSVRISKAGDYLKPMMVQCALAAIKSKKEPYFANKYRRLKHRRGHKKAIIAIARMMVCIYHMVSERKPFNPTNYMEMVEPMLCSVQGSFK